MDRCKLCEQSSDFADAHIIPKSFFVSLRDGNQAPLLVTDRPGILPKRSPIGEYDRTILCKTCEPIFNEWDDYGKIVLQDSIKSADHINDNGKIIGYRLSGIDIPKLRMFFIAVLWRASVSTRDFYKKINLGPFELIAKSRVVNRNPGELNDFSVILAKWDNDWLPVTANPYMIKMDGVNVAVFEMLDYKVYIKVDKRSLPQDMLAFAIGSHKDICIFSRDFRDSKERQVLFTLAPKFIK